LTRSPGGFSLCASPRPHSCTHARALERKPRTTLHRHELFSWHFSSCPVSSRLLLKPKASESVQVYSFSPLCFLHHTCIARLEISCSKPQFAPSWSCRRATSARPTPPFPSLASRLTVPPLFCTYFLSRLRSIKCLEMSHPLLCVACADCDVRQIAS